MSLISLLVFSSFSNAMAQIFTLKGSNKIYSFLAFIDKREVFPRENLTMFYFKTKMDIQIVFSLFPVIWRADPE